MQDLGWIYSVPLWMLFVATELLILCFLEVGYQLGIWNRTKERHEEEGPLGAMVGAMLGLLAFVLAVLFGVAVSRWDARREAFLDEINAIHACYLRAQFLPSPYKNDVRQKLIEYVEIRANAKTLEDIPPAIVRSEELHLELWGLALEANKNSSDSEMTALFVDSLNQIISLHTKRVTLGMRSPIPNILWVVLYGITAMCMVAIGYHTGLSGSSRSWAMLAVALAFSAIIYLIADLERPLEGFIHANSLPMKDLLTLLRRIP